MGVDPVPKPGSDVPLSDDSSDSSSDETADTESVDLQNLG
jgi:hypothetical protein